MSEGSHVMISGQPAVRWQDALPTGNGTIGALVYGNIHRERVVLNHEALWLRRPKQPVPDVSAHLPKLRRMLEEGRYEEAYGFLSGKLEEAGYQHENDPYHPAFDLDILTDTTAPFTDYRRTVDFETGEVCVRWREAGKQRERCLFVSRPDEVVVMRIAAAGEEPMSGTIAVVPHDLEAKVPILFGAGAIDQWVDFEGLYEGGGAFGGLTHVLARGGECETGDDTIHFSGADEVLVLAKLFANEPSEAALERLREEMRDLPADYDRLLERHVAEHRELFCRAEVSLEGGDSERSNERLLLDGYDGEVPVELIRRMFDYGRFLLICSSAPGGWPANLQGVWNGDYDPAWSSDYHNDENIQMNYWAALPGNLAETTRPYFDYYDGSLEDYRANARALYGCRGVLAAISQSTDGRVHPSVWLNWTAGAGWLAQLYYDYWSFTGDDEFLRRRAVPFMKEVALFYEDFLVEGEDGTLMFSPSLSPENTPDRPGGSLVTMNATMDVAVAREVLTHLCDACERLGIEEEGRARWQRILAKLPDYQINEDGAIREWLHPDLPDNYHHRHQSHIYPLFPGLEVTEESDPELFEACRVAVEKRLVVGLKSQTGWSLAHMANIYARLGEGDRALECLELLTRSCVGPNLFTYHNDWRGQGLTLHWGKYPPFQIDANFGLTAAVLEMLLFSRPGMIKLLPALPQKWARGSFSGMLCRGGIEMSADWDMPAGKLSATLTSQNEQEVTLKFPFVPDSLRCNPDGTNVGCSDLGEQYREIVLPAETPVKFTLTRTERTGDA